MKNKVIYLLLVVLSIFTLFGCSVDGNQEDLLKDVVFKNVEIEFDGETHSVYVENLPEGIKVTYEGNNVSDLGVHTVIAKLYDSEDNLLKEMTTTITIVLKATPEVLGDAVFNSVEVDYDGETHSIYVENLPEGYVVSYIGNGVTEVGVYTVVAKVRNENLEVVHIFAATITILESNVVPAELKGVVFNSVEVEYDGKEHSIALENLPEGYLVAYSGNKAINTGIHTVTATVRNSNLEVVYVFTATITIIESIEVELPLV